MEKTHAYNLIVWNLQNADKILLYYLIFVIEKENCDVGYDFLFV